MTNRPTPARFAEAKRKLTAHVPEELYHFVWDLLYEIDALNATIEEIELQRRADEAFEEYNGGDDE